MKLIPILLLASSVSASSIGLWPRGNITGDPCTADGDCNTMLCVDTHNASGKVCGEGNLKEPMSCLEDRQCQSGYCPDGKDGGAAYQCRPASERLFPDDHVCTKDSECQSGYCSSYALRCRPAGVRSPLDGGCVADNDCDSSSMPLKCFPLLENPSIKTCKLTNLPRGIACVADGMCNPMYICSPTAHICDFKAGTGDPNTGNPNTGNPNTGNPNTGNPNTGGGSPKPGSNSPTTVVSTIAGSLVTIVTTPTVANNNGAGMKMSGMGMGLIGAALSWIALL